MSSSSGSGGIKVAAAPCSWGVFEQTEGDPLQLAPEPMLDQMAAAGYAGTELGPPGYFGDGRADEAAAGIAPSVAGGRVPAAALQPCRSTPRRTAHGCRGPGSAGRGRARRRQAQGRPRGCVRGAGAHALGRPDRRAPRGGAAAGALRRAHRQPPSGGRGLPGARLRPGAALPRRQLRASRPPRSRRVFDALDTVARGHVPGHRPRPLRWRGSSGAPARLRRLRAPRPRQGLRPGRARRRCAAPAAASWRPGTAASSASWAWARPTWTASWMRSRQRAWEGWLVVEQDRFLKPGRHAGGDAGAPHRAIGSGSPSGASDRRRRGSPNGPRHAAGGRCCCGRSRRQDRRAAGLLAREAGQELGRDVLDVLLIDGHAARRARSGARS